MVQILRFTGRFLRQLPPDVRMELTEVVWSLADHASLDISHYNVLLQVGLSFPNTGGFTFTFVYKFNSKAMNYRIFNDSAYQLRL